MSMQRFWLPILAGLLVAGYALADGAGAKIGWGTTVPSSCTVPSLFVDTDATSGAQLYLCEASIFVVVNGPGDVQRVGDCTTGDCFTGASGTTLSANTD